MDVPCTVKRLMEGDWLAKAHGSDVGSVEATGRTREQALNLLRDEVRYRLEWCPCSAVADDFVNLVVEDLASTSWRGSVF